MNAVEERRKTAYKIVAAMPEIQPGGPWTALHTEMMITALVPLYEAELAAGEASVQLTAILIADSLRRFVKRGGRIIFKESEAANAS